MSKHLKVGQQEILKLMVQLVPINLSGSKSRAQNVARKLGKGSTDLPPLSRCAPEKHLKSWKHFSGMYYFLPFSYCRPLEATQC